MADALRAPNIFQDSEAWRRLHTPSPDGADQYTVRVKHDVVTVFQSMLAAIATMQKAQHDLGADVTAMANRHEELLDRLFDEEKGAFPRVRTYVDVKIGRLYTACIAVSSSLLTASIVYAATGG